METIAAIATGTSPGGIGVIRISGKEAFSITERVFFPVQKNKTLSSMPGYTAAFGKVMDGQGNRLDDGVALVLRSPNSFTGEDTVELSLHGGPYLLSRVMTALLAAGAVQAGPGEFTKRAFLNGKLDLSAAQAVMETVAAQGEMQLRAASARRDGALYRKIDAIRDALTDLCAHAAAWCDFPEEDVEELTGANMEETMEAVRDKLAKLLSDAEGGIAVTGGIRTAICGRPNVGKSTLMNLLSGCQRSIVTDIPGTTRDVVETTVNVSGLTLLLSDTAGLRDTDDPVEQLGVALSRRKLREAGLLLAVFDGSQPPDNQDEALIRELDQRPGLAVVNKSDLGLCPAMEAAVAHLPHRVTLSAKEEDSLPLLSAAIREILAVKGDDLDGGLLASERELSAAQQAMTAVTAALDAYHMGMTLDAVAVCLQDAAEALGEITGQTASETVIEKVFAQFCVGK